MRFDSNSYSYEQVYSLLKGLPQGSIRVCLERLVKKGYVQRLHKNGRAHFALTAYGMKDMRKRFFKSADEAWDGKWRIAIIPSSLYRKSERIGQLRSRGFGIVQKYTYISPLSFTKDKVFDGLLCCEVSRFASYTNKQVASLVWDLDGLYERYIAWMSKLAKYKRLRRISMEQLVMLVHVYEDIIRDDPRLPSELVLPSWPGTKAENAFLA